MTAPAPRLRYFPISWFSMIMGLAGFTIAWSRAEKFFALDFGLSRLLLGLTCGLALLLAGALLAKLIRYPEEIKAELRHPVKLAFVPTVSIALMLLAAALLTAAPRVSFVLWAAGASGHLLLTLYAMSSWIHQNKYEIVHLNPAWFIPVVGNILVPIAGVHHGPADISWFFFSIGLFFWPMLTAIIFYRLIFHGSLPERFVPTLFIFIAPPAAGFISYLQLTGSLDPVAYILYAVALFFTLLLSVQAGYFIRLKFFLSWWAYSFPLAAITIATLIMAERTGTAFYGGLAAVLLAILSIIIALLLARTGLAVARREICIEGN